MLADHVLLPAGGPDPVVLIPVFASLSSFGLCHHPHRHAHLISWPEDKQRQMPGSPRTRNALHRSSCCDAASDLLARPVRLGNPSPAALVLARAAASYNTEWSSSLSDRPAALSHSRRAPSAPSLRSSREQRARERLLDLVLRCCAGQASIAAARPARPGRRDRPLPVSAWRARSLPSPAQSHRVSCAALHRVALFPCCLTTDGVEANWS